VNKGPARRSEQAKRALGSIASRRPRLAAVTGEPRLLVHTGLVPLGAAVCLTAIT
jgi:hypothetical protein